MFCFFATDKTQNNEEGSHPPVVLLTNDLPQTHMKTVCGTPVCYGTMVQNGCSSHARDMPTVGLTSHLNYREAKTENEQGTISLGNEGGTGGVLCILNNWPFLLVYLCNALQMRNKS